jgi:RNA-directed DNA polymerase
MFGATQRMPLMQRTSTIAPWAKKEEDPTEGKPTWVEASIWTDRMVLALGNGVKGGKWYSLADKAIRLETLNIAWEHVERNKGSSGIDGVSVERFAAGAERYLAELHEDLKSGRYRPSPVKRVEIPKGNGQTRPLGIPSVKDRIVQTALKMAMEPIFETQFRKGSYGFRPGLGCKDALREVDRLLKEGYTHVVDADLKSYFDTIPRDGLMERVAEKISDGRVLALIEGFLLQDVMKGMERWTPTAGTPQGAVISPLLANIYLHPLDLLMEELGFRMVRYADDFVILCRTAEEAASALRQVTAWTTANGLTLHPDKTRIGDARQPGQGFDFLGYRFENGRRFVRDKSRRAFKDKARALTKRSRGDSLQRIIKDLNPRLRGWFEYFKHAVPSELRQMDSFIRRRLRAILRKQEKRPAFGLCPEDHRRWPNAYFASLGLFTMSTARYRAKHSR